MFKKNYIPYFILIVGIILSIVGFTGNLILKSENPAFSFTAGFGNSWICLGAVFTFLSRNQSAEKIKKREINQKDERNIAIREKSGLFAYIITVFLMTILMFTFIFLNIMLAFWLVFAFLMIIIFSFIGLTFYFDKKL